MTSERLAHEMRIKQNTVETADHVKREKEVSRQLQDAHNEVTQQAELIGTLKARIQSLQDRVDQVLIMTCHTWYEYTLCHLMFKLTSNIAQILADAVPKATAYSTSPDPRTILRDPQKEVSVTPLAQLSRHTRDASVAVTHELIKGDGIASSPSAGISSMHDIIGDPPLQHGHRHKRDRRNRKRRRYDSSTSATSSSESTGGDDSSSSSNSRYRSRKGDRRRHVHHGRRHKSRDKK